ncbi:hypothetical protein ElyMa_002442500 [Elysia marginata]|uniref:Uncharacterized protein n=1 Tax=Elysia marginata TaxID=1093978 RepID=A0AAV4GKB7_9GAST|nr:hypothetical protein ElyMa_002442500 [Elysia marginata]
MPLLNKTHIRLSSLSLPELQRTANTPNALLQLAEMLPNVVSNDELGLLDKDLRANNSSVPSPAPRKVKSINETHISPAANNSSVPSPASKKVKSINETHISPAANITPAPSIASKNLKSTTITPATSPASKNFKSTSITSFFKRC